VDVVIPAFDEEACIGDCLDAVFGQDYPADRLRVWVVDAGSTDRTADVVRARARSDPRLTLITGRRRLNAGEAMRVGIAAGNADLVARVDAHTYLAPGYLRAGVARMAELGPRLALVGGQPTQLGTTTFGRAVARARRSRFGVGGSVYADRRTCAYVDTVQGGLFRRQALDAVGGFGTGFPTGEDEECNWRLRRAGYDVLLDTGLAFAYTARSSWAALFRQHRHYGASRALVVARHPAYLRPRHIVPGAFVATTGGLALAALLGRGRGRRARRALAALLGTYGTGVAVAAAFAARDEPRLAPRVAAAFTAMHIGYGSGSLAGVAAILRARLGLGAPRTTVVRR
jgi:cellulose synthase/poly-beta-1,6-N-acetylglucosamine synthase-like glycosyltransferase